MVTLAAGPCSVTVDLENGGRISEWRVYGLQLVEPRNAGNHPFGWGSYPMVPYAGRIRNGEFRFDGVDVEMPVTLGGHGIHGTAYDQPWDLLMAGSSWCVLGARLGPPWPFGGTVTQLIHLCADRLVQELTVHAADRDMPATIGWHPWFRRQLERGGPLRLDLDLSEAKLYEKDATGMPTGELVDLLPLPWDDCFRGVGSIRMVWPGALSIDVLHECDDVVIYTPPHAMCVEPQSAPPDAFTLTPDASRLHAGSSLERTVTWRWLRASSPS